MADHYLYVVCTLVRPIARGLESTARLVKRLENPVRFAYLTCHLYLEEVLCLKSRSPVGPERNFQPPEEMSGLRPSFPNLAKILALDVQIIEEKQ